MLSKSTIHSFGRFRLNPASRELTRDGEPVSCPRRVFDLLVYLVEQRERAVGRDELASAVYGRVDVTDVQLGQLVLRARRAVDDDGTAQHSIATVPGFGYRWVAPTQAIALVLADHIPDDVRKDLADPALAQMAGPDGFVVELPPQSPPPSAGPGPRVALVVAIAAMLVVAGLWR